MGQSEFNQALGHLENDFSQFIFGLGFHFPRTEGREAAADYIRGLLSKVERKNSWQLAEATGHKTPTAFQHLLGRANWDEDALRDEHIEEVLFHFGDCGTLSIDETGFVKKGTKSAGVQRQYCGCVGKIENSQIGVFLNWKTNKGHVLLDRELYLPKSWCDDKERCRQVGIPEDAEFKTKPQLAEQMLSRAFDLGAKPTWVLGDEVYGKDTHLRFFLEEKRQPYVLAVASNQYISIGFSQFSISKSLQKIEDKNWYRLSAGTGSKGQRLYDWAAFQINHPFEDDYQRWGLLRRSISNPKEVSFYLVFGSSKATLKEMVKACGSRWSIEEDFETAKGEVGLDQYEVRSFHGWYRHITLAMRAQYFLVQTRSTLFPPPSKTETMADFKKKRGLRASESVFKNFDISFP